MRNEINKLVITATGLVGITAVVGLVLAGSYVSADDVVDNVSITVSESCTISGSGMSSHTAEITNGAYQANIGTTTIDAFCNDSAGFSIYATGFTGDTIGETDSNKLVGTSASGNATIATGTATSAGNPDVSNWAMKLTTTTDPAPAYPIIIKGSSLDTERQTGDTDYSAFSAVPNSYTKVATRTSGTDVCTGATGSSLTTTYAAYISKTQPADTYTGKVKYTLVHPSNGQAPAVPICRPNGTTIDTIVCMQDISSANKSSILASMTEDYQYTLQDGRDEKTYYVAKLKDGNIWMTQNLDLDLDSSKTYTSADTDIASDWTPSTSTYSTGTTTWNSSNTTPESYDPGDLYWNGTAGDYSSETDCTNASGTWDSSTSMCNLISSTGDAHYHLGNYYNWTAAIATNNSSSYTEEDTIANQSICPAGWTLPKSSYDESIRQSSGAFSHLMEQYGWEEYTYMDDPYPWNTPIKIALSGSWWGAQGHVGNNGFYTSSVASGSGSAYHYYVSYDGSIYDNDEMRDSGISVRCVTR